MLFKIFYLFGKLEWESYLEREEKKSDWGTSVWKIL